MNDFTVSPPIAKMSDELKRGLLREAVVEAFAKAGLFENSAQKMGMLRFFDLYNNAKKGSEVIEDWKKNHTDTWGKELEFKPDYYKTHVLPEIFGGGVFSAQGIPFNPAAAMLDNYSGVGKGLGLSSDVYYTLNNLAGREIAVDKMPVLGRVCGGMVMGLIYNPAKIPDAVKQQVQELYSWLQGIKTFLGSYRQIECEGEGCPEHREDALFFIEVDAGSEVGDVRTGNCQY